MFKAKEQLIKCQPPIWAKARHIHTIAAYLIPSENAGSFDERHLVPVSDGDHLLSFYFKGTKKISLYLFHGLSGDTDSSYMQRTCILGRNLGAHVYLTNHRGCGAGKGLSREPYHSGRTDDICKVVALGRSRNPDHLHIVVGFSLSGNVTLLVASGVGVETKDLPDCVIAVNAPIHLEKAAKNLSVGFNRLYDQQFVGEAKRAFQARKQKNALAKEYQFPKFLTTYRFDAAYTGHAAGYDNRENYYKKCSAVEFLSEVKIPTLILTSEDDPFVDVNDFKYAKTSNSVQMHIEKYGGHMGYLNKKQLPFGGIRWLDYFMHEQISHLIRAC